jgi:hypothetical protein
MLCPTPPTETLSQSASAERITRTAAALEANGFHTLIAENAARARELFFELVPPGSQIHQGASKTLEQLGITAEIESSGRYDALRPKMRAMDRQTQANEIRHLIASPDVMTGSVGAVTEDGHVLAASATGSQLGPYVFGAGKVVWIVGVNKIVKDLPEGFRRLEERVLPLENQRTLQAYNMQTSLNKILVFNKERPGRITIILVNEELGF